MQLNTQGIYDVVTSVHRQIAQRMCCLSQHSHYQERMPRYLLPAMPLGITAAMLEPTACSRCQAAVKYADWTRNVWSKYAEKEWKFQTTLMDAGVLDRWPSPSVSELTKRGRWWTTRQNFDYGARAPDTSPLGVLSAMSYRDRDYEKYMNVRLTAQDSDWSTAQHEQVELQIGVRGVRTMFPGRRQPREATVEFRVPYSDWTYALKDGLVFVDGQMAAAELMDLYDWWVNNPDSIPKQLTRLSVKQALAASEKWHDRQAKKQRTGPMTKDDKTYLGELTITYKRLKEGYNQRNSISQALRVWTHSDSAYEEEVRTYKVHELKTAKALQEEGDAMRNCIGSYYTELSHSRFASVVGENRNDSFSVHFKDGMVGGIVILQARGFANRALETSEERQLQAGLEQLTAMQKA